MSSDAVTIRFLEQAISALRKQADEWAVKYARIQGDLALAQGGPAYKEQADHWRSVAEAKDRRRYDLMARHKAELARVRSEHRAAMSGQTEELEMYRRERYQAADPVDWIDAAEREACRVSFFPNTQNIHKRQ